MGGGDELTAEKSRRKKKKGRPSLLELQKRSLKQQQELEEPQQSKLQKSPNLINPNSSIKSNRRSTHRDPDLNGGDANVDDGDDRRKKKHKLLLGFNSSRNHQHYPVPSTPNSASHGSDSNADGDDPEASLERSKVKPGSDRMGEKLSKATDTLHGSPVESGPTTPLPDKKLLVFILDRLQKKDTYRVFSEPVDPEELPDYHDIIAHPMDFSTVRKKLDGGAYTTLEQFEMDVFLICSNAMQYNAPDTIYFRKARSIQELAKKDFENLRQQDSDEGEPQPKVVRRGRPPGKSLKKSSLVSSSFDCVGSEHSSDATLAAGRDASSLSNTYKSKKGPNSHKLRPADTLIKPSWGSPYKENNASCSSEWENEFPASVVKFVMKYGMKHFAVDENRRNTYNHSLTSEHDHRIFSTLDGEQKVKQLIPVGLSAENGYATSLARFSANLGPAVWQIASRKSESVSPSGLKFGPGCAGENRTVEQPQCSYSDKQTGRFLSAATNSIASSKFPLHGREDTEKVGGPTSQNDSTSTPSHPFQQKRLLLPHSGINGSTGAFGTGYSSQMGMVTQLVNSLSGMTSVPTQTHGMVSGASDYLPKEAKLEDSSVPLHSGNAMAMESYMVSHAATNVGLQRKSHNDQNFLPFAPSSDVPIGSPQYPDLALQL